MKTIPLDTYVRKMITKLVMLASFKATEQDYKDIKQFINFIKHHLNKGE